MEISTKKCDLHIHSTFSDSDTTVEEIFKLAKSCNISCIAITDHDTISGIEQAKYYSKIYGVELIEAIEISAQKDDFEVHLLGYFIDSKHKLLKEALSNIKDLRRERLALMIEKLNYIGINIKKDEVFEKIADNVPTRLHLALFLLEKKIVSSLKDAFRLYLSPGKPAYVARFKYSVREAIEIIKSCGGLAFLAHPHLFLKQSWIEEFIVYGLDGLEVMYPRMPQNLIAIYENMAEKFGLLKSGGSDAHGSYKEFTKIGEISIPYSWVEKMKMRLS
ncbi:MAG: PHP domain-containing protein [Candidatus Omnitrophica bacterium]|nr:PHP domain-containing protein [Candidatus Omnitrophota bacterium]